MISDQAAIAAASGSRSISSLRQKTADTRNGACRFSPVHAFWNTLQPSSVLSVVVSVFDTRIFSRGQKKHHTEAFKVVMSKIVGVEGVGAETA